MSENDSLESKYMVKMHIDMDVDLMERDWMRVCIQTFSMQYDGSVCARHRADSSWTIPVCGIGSNSS